MECYINLKNRSCIYSSSWCKNHSQPLECIMRKCEKFTEMVAENKRGLGDQVGKWWQPIAESSAPAFCNTFLYSKPRRFSTCFHILHPTSKWKVCLKDQQGNYLLLYKTNDSRSLLLLEEYSHFGTAIFIPPDPIPVEGWRKKLEKVLTHLKVQNWGLGFKGKEMTVWTVCIWPLE